MKRIKKCNQRTCKRGCYTIKVNRRKFTRAKTYGATGNKVNQFWLVTVLHDRIEKIKDLLLDPHDEKIEIELKEREQQLENLIGLQ